MDSDDDNMEEVVEGTITTWKFVFWLSDSTFMRSHFVEESALLPTRAAKHASPFRFGFP